MTKIINFDDLLKIKDKEKFDELVDGIIYNITEHYNQKIY